MCFTASLPLVDTRCMLLPPTGLVWHVLCSGALPCHDVLSCARVDEGKRRTRREALGLPLSCERDRASWHDSRRWSCPLSTTHHRTSPRYSTPTTTTLRSVLFDRPVPIPENQRRPKSVLKSTTTTLKPPGWRKRWATTTFPRSSVSEIAVAGRAVYVACPPSPSLSQHFADCRS